MPAVRQHDVQPAELINSGVQGGLEPVVVTDVGDGAEHLPANLLD